MAQFVLFQSWNLTNPATSACDRKQVKLISSRKSYLSFSTGGNLKTFSRECDLQLIMNLNFHFKLPDRQTDRQNERQTDRQTCRGKTEERFLPPFTCCICKEIIIFHQKI